jgi:hypothetical protein
MPRGLPTFLLPRLKDYADNIELVEEANEKYAAADKLPSSCGKRDCVECLSGVSCAARLLAIGRKRNYIAVGD